MPAPVRTFVFWQVNSGAQILLFTLGLLCWATAGNANSILTGKVTLVRDGDTIVVGDQPVRLSALDCPEKNRFGGDEATALMRRLTSGATVTCERDGTMTYDRVVGYCSARGRVLVD